MATLTLCALAGCSNGKFTPPELPKIDLAGLAWPTTPDGKYVLIQATTAHFEIDPTASDAITAVGTCSDLITYCFSSGEPLDTCVEATSDCQTQRPWEERTCCPSACKAAYQKARKTAEPIDAFERAFFLEPDCFPGLRAALEAK
jgi:hypothetical protein